MSIKLERLNHTFTEAISKVINEEVKDEDIKFVTITGVDITNDLSYAKVYFTVLDEEKKKVVTDALNGAKGFIRKELSERIEIRHTPELKFIYDDSISYGEHIEDIIDKINDNKV